MSPFKGFDCLSIRQLELAAKMTIVGDRRQCTGGFISLSDKAYDFIVFGGSGIMSSLIIAIFYNKKSLPYWAARIERQEL